MILREIRRPIDILLVEDNPGDVYIIRTSLSESKVTYNFHHAIDGEEAMAFLRREGKYTNSPRPHLILLDLNLPKKHGFEVLKEIKTDPELKAIPVVILTSSKAEPDIVNSYHLYASCYVTKPLEFNDFNQVIKSIEDFWLNCAKLPCRC